jgi:hypothetical protein
MNTKEKLLYRQIHPLKLTLLRDSVRFIRFGAIGWRFGVVMLAPPAIASFLVIRYANLEPYRRSAFGRYLARHTTPAMEALHLAGMAVMAIGAWVHSSWLILLGICVIPFGWLRGMLRHLISGQR